MILRHGVAALALVAAGAAGVRGEATTAKSSPATAKSEAVAATKAALKTEIKLDTTEAALRSYIEAWKNMEYPSIMACITITDAGKKKTVEMYINYYMWRAALERACIAKFGEEEGSAVLGHPRSIDKQLELDLKRLLQSPNVEYDLKDRKQAHVFLRQEKDRPAGLDASDEVVYRDDYHLLNVGATVTEEGRTKAVAAWKVDYLKTQNLSDPDPERQNVVRFNVDVAFPRIARKLKELTEKVKAGDIKSGEEVKDRILNEWAKIDMPENKEGSAAPKDD